MSKGENIYRRRDGRREAHRAGGRLPSGRIRYGFCRGKARRETGEKAAKAHPAASGGQKFAFYCGEWLNIAQSRVKPASYVKYESMLKNHIIPGLGGYLPSKLTTFTVSRFSESLTKEKLLSPKTVRDILTCLRAVINYAEKQLPGTFGAIDIVYPRETVKETRVLTPAEQRRLTQFLLIGHDACKSGILLALLTGLRIGEICALRWEDVDLTEQTLRVHATMQRLKAASGGSKTQIVIGPPKSEKSSRVIPMTEQAAELCMRMQVRNAEAFVLTGTPRCMEPRALQYRLARYTAACGLEDVHFHTLRHTFATRCVEVGFDIKSLSEILGHSSTSVTLNRYVHPSLELKRENMNKLTAAGM